MAVKEVLPDGKTRDTGVRVIVPRADSPVMKENKAKGDDVITIEEMRKWLDSKGQMKSPHERRLGFPPEGKAKRPRPATTGDESGCAGIWPPPSGPRNGASSPASSSSSG